MITFSFKNGIPFTSVPRSKVYCPTKRATQLSNNSVENKTLNYDDIRKTVEAAIKAGRIAKPDPRLCQKCNCDIAWMTPGRVTCPSCSESHDAVRKSVRTRNYGSGTCPFCSKGFTKRIPDQVSCGSVSCRHKMCKLKYKAKLEKNRPGWMDEKRKCRICERSFAPVRVNQATCAAPDCMKKNRYARNRYNRLNNTSHYKK